MNLVSERKRVRERTRELKKVEKSERVRERARGTSWLLRISSCLGKN